MMKPKDVRMAEKLAMHVADVVEKDDFQENHENVSCKISFILSLLVRVLGIVLPMYFLFDFSAIDLSVDNLFYALHGII